MRAAACGGALEDILVRAADAAAYDRWAAQGRASNWCTHPVRLTGSTTAVDRHSGEILDRYSTATEPDGVLLKACGQRRTTACPQCAEIYRSDAWHLIAAGLRGGKGVAPAVARHPAVFVTLTAPSFGPVHSLRERSGRARRCRPGRPGLCPHGRALACREAHQPDDDRVGTPLCPDCFDYPRTVLWNALATELWRRTTIGISRSLAAETGCTLTAFGRAVRLSFVKIVEYQQRGAVHIHAVVRLDGREDADPAPAVSVATLERAVRSAAARSQVRFPTGAGVPGAATWGRQIDVRPIAVDHARAEAVAAYIAKYATKSTDALGRLDHKLKADDLALLDLPDHLARLVTTAWELGGRSELADFRLRDWAHTLGFRGHWLTKSRRYSTTFGALRSARATWKASRRNPGPRQPETAVDKDWRYAGRGWANPGDAWLAETAAADFSETRRLAREARRTAATTAQVGP